MENTLQEPVVAETPVNATATKQEEKKKKTPLFYINIILLLVVLVLGAYILNKEGYLGKEGDFKIGIKNSAEEEKKGDGSVIVEVKEAELNDFTGKYIKAKLPEGWIVKEYKDGEGSDLVVEGSDYPGLTGLEIFHGNKSIMTIHILDGVGAAGCGRIALFKDSPENFKEEKEKMNKQIGVEADILDYTNTTYSAITLFGLRMRRVGTNVFYDGEVNTMAFEASCERNWLPLEGLKEVAPLIYFQAVISEEATSDELAILDSILGTLEVK